MENKKKEFSKKRKLGRAFVLLFCGFIAIAVTFILTYIYQPSQNALGALGSVCMDIICMAILIILIISVSFEREEINTTTKLFIGLMMGTMIALFFDFLNWSFDGSLLYGHWTFVFTISSLCCGSVLAAILALYLSSYLEDMYDIVSLKTGTKVCVVLDAVAFLITVSLGFTKKAFVFVNGHYSPGPLYDVITVIPVLTLFYLMGFLAFHIKKIGIHDVFAVAGYIFTMIAGALIESSFGIGATYVSVAIADVFIFIMLQNKLIDRVNKQKEMLSERITSQYAILESMAGIYSHVNYVDLKKMTERRFDIKDSVVRKIEIDDLTHSSMNKSIYENIEDDLKEKFWAFTDLTTLPFRMSTEKIISAEFHHKTEGWFRAQYIRIGNSLNKPIEKVIYAIRNIDEEKKNVEKWINISNTDELTGFYNRHAYEDDIALLRECTLPENFIYISIDVNSLKMVNDTLGHEAGDELLLGACECMKQAMGSYGKIYRTGGDEFVAIIYADDVQLETIKTDIEELTENWCGRLIDGLAISCGYVSRKEDDKLSLHEMAVLADKRMYEAKNNYYKKRGIDRRGQKDAHVALYALYTKILKIDLNEDSYQVISISDEERTSDKGFRDSLSDWLREFALSGQVHPEDLDEFMQKTDISTIRKAFSNGIEFYRMTYRRKSEDGYTRVLLEMIPANDYSVDNPRLFLYVKDIS